MANIPILSLYIMDKLLHCPRALQSDDEDDEDEQEASTAI